MDLEASYPSQEDIPQEYADLYTEKDGKWVFTAVKGMVSSSEHSGVKGALDKERANHKKTEKSLTAYQEAVKKAQGDGEGTVDDLEDLALELGELREKGGEGDDEEKFQITVDQRVTRELKPIERERDQYKTQAEEAQGTLLSLQGKIDGKVIHEHLRKAAVDAKCDPRAIDDIVDLQARSFEVHRNGEGDQETEQVIARDNVGLTPGITPGDHFADIKAAGAKTHWWPESVGSDLTGNKGGAGGTNPWLPGDGFNLTGQARIQKDNPSLAKRLKEQAQGAKAA